VKYKVILLSTVILLFLTGLIIGCDIRNEGDIVQATVTIPKIVDKATQRPIEMNFITARWERRRGKFSTQKHSAIDLT